MPPLADTVRRNLESVESRIAGAATKAGRDPSDITLVGVAKYVDAAATAALVEAGCSVIGESRPQQLWSKAEAPELAGKPIEWRLIGHLQRNKIDRTLPIAREIQSVDSERLLRAIDASAAKQGLTARVLLEANCSGDAEKHGFSSEELKRLLPELPMLKSVEVCGLMTMAAREGGPTVARQNFAALRELRDTLRAEAPPGLTLDELSMGMSGDFEEAILEGATSVRVGSALWSRIE
ncbi:YggS family pyridoxal phosphate-dependent enzyme [Pseudobythopirellula maris]|nr:YggS family pyridoxal phosphate-dependent enzyme [Pseudobythopirellula maris]